MIAPQSLLSRRTLLLSALALGASACSREADAPASAVSDEAAPPPPPQAAGDLPVVALLGDSITAGYGLPAKDALPAQLEAALAAAGTPVRVRAAGVSGDTTAGALARVDFSIQDDTDLCVVALGGNDLLQGIEPATMRANLEGIITRLKARNIPVLLAGMQAPPSYGAYATDFAAVFEGLARDHDVALYPFLLDGVALDPALNQDDGIHPNAAGVKVIAQRLAPAVAGALAGA
ncbi:MAG: arylesterase [Phenylobacterium sp.]|uniref:arylesterase n=1 Tax=Phenylobacterium sp. TaxID=1871053 RepID=UPI0027331035|nr:arylesterase [Phenylobacterium sp.]MDP1642838.1 arylesterase [Phenylobacterium sp.]MDP3116391.1 arylesterase [Phenylobacterium sp.]